MQIVFLNSYLDDYDDLTAQDKERVQRAIHRLGDDWRHPGLGVKRVQGKDDVWEARASLSLRITFQIIGDTIRLRNVGAHDKTLKDA